MHISRNLTLSALGLLCVIGCSSGDKNSGDGDPAQPSADGGSGSVGTSAKGGGKNGTGTAGVGSSKATGTAGAGSSASTGTSGVGSSTGTGSSTGSGSSTGTGSATGSTGGSSGTSVTGTGSSTAKGGSASGTNTAAVGSNGTTGDPISAGGSGTTGDPGGLGGSGTTGDPGGLGGNGSTGDPVGGNGNTGDPAGGSGNTGDPAGGKGNTGDPAGGSGNTGDPAGGSGNTGDPPPSCVPTQMAKVNVIVFNDASPSGADSEGAMYVGRNLTTAGYSIGSSESAGLTCSDYGLAVGGNVTGSVVVGNGKVGVAGVNNQTTTPRQENNADPCGITKTLPAGFASLPATFTGYSTAFKNYTANGTVSGSVKFTGTNALNVFNVTGAQLTSASQVEFSLPAGSSAIVNVSGTTISWHGVGFLMPDGTKSCRGGTSDWCHRIMWNFYEATTIDLGGIGVQGSILAPYATQSGSGGNVDGQVIVKNLTGGIEYHPYFFSGCLIFAGI